MLRISYTFQYRQQVEFDPCGDIPHLRKLVVGSAVELVVESAVESAAA